jgi:hypothetical protein
MSSSIIFTSVLAKNPRIVLEHTERWMGSTWAASTNETIRIEGIFKNRPNTVLSDHTNIKINHAIPGQAVYQLEKILGMEDGPSILATRAQVISILFDNQDDQSSQIILKRNHLNFHRHVRQRNINHQQQQQN